jgi:hypothetical protein
MKQYAPDERREWASGPTGCCCYVAPLELRLQGAHVVIFDTIDDAEASGRAGAAKGQPADDRATRSGLSKSLATGVRPHPFTSAGTSNLEAPRHDGLSDQ